MTAIARLFDRQREPTPSEQGPVRLGTFAGVFTPTVLTILGAIMYLRLGWVVGNAGILGAIGIILLAHVITVTTGLAVSSIATNIRVGAGGAFSIISQSLGLEVGGSVGFPLWVAQTVSVALYVLAFSEGWLRIFPGASTTVVAVITLGVVFAIAYISTAFATRIQFLILAIVFASLVSIGMGTFPSLGGVGFQQTPQLWGSFERADFWATFAIFFPAVTGIMAGISLSGQLADPRESIPRGTLSAIGLTMAIYLALAWWLARIASPEALIGNTTIMVDQARFGWVVLAGILGATFSSALGSIVAAPRVLQALGMHRILPRGSYFAKETETGEARNAMLVTGALGLFFLLFALAGGGLDAIAPLITMFFLLTYTVLNVVVLVEQRLAMVSFRPMFRVPWVVPFLGMLSCLFVMFLVNPAFSLVAIVLTLALYAFLLKRSLPGLEQGDVRSGLMLSIARWAARRVGDLPAAPERTWSPNLLAPVQSPDQLSGSYRMLLSLVRPNGSLRAVGIYAPDERQAMEELPWLVQGYRNEGIDARALLLEAEHFIEGTRAAMELLGSTFFRPNTLFVPLREDLGQADLDRLVGIAAAQRMGLIMPWTHPVKGLGREQRIHVWIRDQSPDWLVERRLGNLDLVLLLAYQLARNWKGRVYLYTAVSKDEDRPAAERYLEEILSLARLSRIADFEALVLPYREALESVPAADLSILGLPDRADIEGIRALAPSLRSSFLIVRDSGDESIFA
jgi:amino acid transporter